MLSVQDMAEMLHDGPAPMTSHSIIGCDDILRYHWLFEILRSVGSANARLDSRHYWDAGVLTFALIFDIINSSTSTQQHIYAQQKWVNIFLIINFWIVLSLWMVHCIFSHSMKKKHFTHFCTQNVKYLLQKYAIWDTPNICGYDVLPTNYLTRCEASSSSASSSLLLTLLLVFQPLLSHR